MKTLHIIIITALVLAVIGIFSFPYTGLTTVVPGEYDDFASCLTEKGAKFYGSYQCPHCNTQKDLFGKSMRFIDYIECGPLRGPQNAVCVQAGIRAYPTWIFSDNSREEGVLSLNQLSEKTNCELS